MKSVPHDMGFQRNVPSMRPLLPRSRPEDKAQWHPLLHVPWWHWCTHHWRTSHLPALRPLLPGLAGNCTETHLYADMLELWYPVPVGVLWPGWDRGQQKFCEHDPKKK